MRPTITNNTLLVAKYANAGRVLESDALVVVAVSAAGVPPLQLWEYSYLLQYIVAAEQGYTLPEIRMATCYEMDWLDYGFFRRQPAAYGMEYYAEHLMYRAEVDRMDCCMDASG